MHPAILCSAYASVRFVGNHTVRQDLAIELGMYKTQLLNNNNLKILREAVLPTM